MDVEEITLSVPGQAGPPQPAGKPAAAAADAETDRLDRLVRGYLQAARARDRLALNERARQRRQERFNLALKSLIKTMANEASSSVPERRARMHVRTRSYLTMMVLARITAQDHVSRARRARSVLRWGLMLASVGLAGTAFTLVANGWLPLPDAFTG